MGNDRLRAELLKHRREIRKENRAWPRTMVAIPDSQIPVQQRLRGVRQRLVFLRAILHNGWKMCKKYGFVVIS
jgi:hypothetical protein